jgi:hypothetical protein
MGKPDRKGRELMRSKIFAGAAACAIVVLTAIVIAGALGAFGSPVSSASGSTPAKNDAIKVHGAWTIEIRDRGRTVRTAQFHNELTTKGAEALVSILARQSSVGQWMIGLTPQLCGTATAQQYCWIDESGGTVAQTHTVVVSTPDTGDDAGKLVLKATLVATIDNSINVVQTSVIQCPPSTAPATPCDGSGFLFSRRDLAAPIPVVAGQQVLITVKYSFS